jgi:hypothetical protein
MKMLGTLGVETTQAADEICAHILLIGLVATVAFAGARLQSKTRTSWQAIVKASSAALRAPGGTYLQAR